MTVNSYALVHVAGHRIFVRIIWVIFMVISISFLFLYGWSYLRADKATDRQGKRRTGGQIVIDKVAVDAILRATEEREREIDR